MTFAAPIVTLQALLEFDSSDRWKVWAAALGWCVLAATFAEVMFWAALATLDRCAGRTKDLNLWD
jgi:hypothetical protein